MLNKKVFSERLKLLRSSRNISQEILAKALGKGKSAISMMESAQSSATADTLIAISDYFDVSLDYLVGRSDNSERI
ncbi:MAG: helix-turn-helix transcriptional regulator [Defluviitaleaceae bacterium]|nr:helix-turn-helix transcriptional regulator [Defluviitaleaceae bacterium]